MKSGPSYLVPAAIIAAGFIIALGVFFARGGPTKMPEGGPEFMRAVSPEDHLVGNPQAKVVVVEYSDIDCPYCKEFQATMTQLMSEYGPNGEVAWVYRHFPLVELHEHAASHAEAAECVAEQGGSQPFFAFIDYLQQSAPAGLAFDPKDYPDAVASLNLSLPSFEECMASDRMVAKVAADFDNAIEAGASGTPYIVLLVRGANPIPISGALPYTSMKKVLEAALEKAL